MLNHLIHWHLLQRAECLHSEVSCLQCFVQDYVSAELGFIKSDFRPWLQKEMNYSSSG